MGYVPGIPDNDTEHRKYCDLMCNGPRTRATLMQADSWPVGSDQVLLVTSASPERLRKLAHAASMCANHEMHYDGGIYRYNDPPDDRDIHLFLWRRGERIVALLIFERRSHVWKCTWSDGPMPECIDAPHKGTMWSVGFVWVHKKHRHSGLARTLFLEAKQRMQLAEDDVGWYTPFSPDGESFVKRLYPHAFWVAK